MVVMATGHCHRDLLVLTLPPRGAVEPEGATFPAESPLFGAIAHPQLSGDSRGMPKRGEVTLDRHTTTL